MTEEELAELQKMVIKAAEGVESRLANSLDKAIEGINSKIDSNAAAASELQAKAKTAFDTLPALIQEHVETQLRANLTSIVEEIGKQFEGKVAQARGNTEGGDSGLTIDKLLANADKVVSVVNAFRSPTTEQAMLGQMNLIFRWHGLLSKLEKGGGSPDDATKAIADIFKTQE